MNKTQLKVLWVGIGIIVLMGLFPPTIQHSRYGSTSSVIYRFILNAEDILFNRLFIQWIIIVVITGGLICTLKVDPDILLKIRWRILKIILTKEAFEEKLQKEKEKRKSLPIREHLGKSQNLSE